MTDRILPINFTWRELDVMVDGGEVVRLCAMVPKPGAAMTQAKRQYEADEEYALGPVEERSQASHNAFFAELHQYWSNLPEKIAARWLNESHFRYWCLIETSHYVESEVDCASEKHATQLVAIIKSFDVYARFMIRGSKVIIRRAKSQSRKSMKKAEFEQAKRDVLDLAASFVSVSPAQMRQHARQL